VLALNAQGSSLFRTTENNKILIFHLACQRFPSTSYKRRRSAEGIIVMQSYDPQPFAKKGHFQLFIFDERIVNVSNYADGFP
jgi:hypothetical protein